MSSLAYSGSPITEPIPTEKTPPAWGHTFISFGVRNYRLFAFSSVVGTVAFWMQRIAQDWLVLDVTGSVAAVGVTAALQFAPLLVLGLFSGSLVDHFPRRAILQITQAVSCATHAVLAVLVFVGEVQVWHIYASAFVLGLVTAVDWPARSVFANDLVPPHLLGNALSMNSSVFQLAGFLGPMIGGLVLAGAGAGWVFAIGSAGLVVSIGLLALICDRELQPSPPRGNQRGRVREGLRYVVGKPGILLTIVPLGAVAVFALNLPVFLAGFANERFEVGAAGFSAFNGAVALGAFAAALLSTRRRTVSLQRILATAMLYTSVVCAVAWIPNPWIFAAGLSAVGFCWLTLATSSNFFVQISANPGIRGRVMAVYTVVLYGGQAVGGPLVGWAVQHLGAPIALCGGAGIAGAVAAIVALAAARRRVVRGDSIHRVASRHRRIAARPSSASDDDPPVTDS